MNANRRIEYVKEVVSRMKSLVDAELVHPSPQIALRTLDNKKYSVTYNDQRKKFSVVQRVNVGDMSEDELLDFLRR